MLFPLKVRCATCKCRRERETVPLRKTNQVDERSLPKLLQRLHRHLALPAPATPRWRVQHSWKSSCNHAYLSNELESPTQKHVRANGLENGRASNIRIEFRQRFQSPRLAGDRAHRASPWMALRTDWQGTVVGIASRSGRRATRCSGRLHHTCGQLEITHHNRSERPGQDGTDTMAGLGRRSFRRLSEVCRLCHRLSP